MINQGLSDGCLKLEVGVGIEAMPAKQAFKVTSP
jgi:hypothetical protein